MNTPTSSTSANCPLCDLLPDFLGWSRDGRRMLEVECKRCGRFKISEQACYALGEEKDQRHLLSAVCRTRADGTITEILTTNIAELISRAPNLTNLEKFERMLTLLAQRTPELGKTSEFDMNDDYPLLALRNCDEAGYLLGALQERNYITQKSRFAQLTFAGWERVEQILESGPQSRYAFVAMWFDESTERLYDEAIKPAIREARYEPIRIDRREHVNRIDDEIIGQIRRSRFMVADFTGQRHGVYFETGLMMGLGRNVIWMCKKEELHQIHFDVRQYNFIDWESIEDARNRLQHRILAIEGEGPDAPKEPKN